MKIPDWTQIDHYQFVKLTGDLLARLGFVDIDFQGDGPDGGIDLFATELVPFTIQGRSPFRWAVQCKFSSAGTSASVNDQEVRDVEGILRSERYQAQDPRGYMLITNRRIVQNVIERLRGIDRRSSFRTARIDGAELESLLNENSELVDRYLRVTRPAQFEDAMPSIIATPSSEPSTRFRPTVTVHLSLPAGKEAIAAHGIIDTGVDMTVVPADVIAHLAPPTDHMVAVYDFAGSVHQLRSVRLDIRIEQVTIPAAPVVVADVKEVLIGLDLLSSFTVVLDTTGPIKLYRHKLEVDE